MGSFVTLEEIGAAGSEPLSSIATIGGGGERRSHWSSIFSPTNCSAVFQDTQVRDDRQGWVSGENTQGLDRVGERSHTGGNKLCQQLATDFTWVAEKLNLLNLLGLRNDFLVSNRMELKVKIKL